MSRKAYRRIVQWSDEDNCFIGTCPELFFGGVHGKDEIRVYRELRCVVAEWEQYDRAQARNKRKRKSSRSRRRTA